MDQITAYSPPRQNTPETQPTTLVSEFPEPENEAPAPPEQTSSVEVAAGESQAEPKAEPSIETEQPTALSEAVAAAEPEKPAPLVMKRRTERSSAELLAELARMPELSLEKVPGASSQTYLATRSRLQMKSGADHALLQLFLIGRDDLRTLPFLKGDDCRAGKEEAENLQALSRRLRGLLSQAVPSGSTGDSRPDAVALRQLLLAEKHHWLQTDAVPTLTQMLMAENRPVRLLLVELLSEIKGKRASTALAQRAVFDLDADVREAAVQALHQRPHAEYQKVLLDGLRYPWAPAADHAAEALATLEMYHLVPDIINLLEQGDPAGPFRLIAHPQAPPVVREVVRLNHLRNCLLCHAPSYQSNDLVRGAVPNPSQPLPATTTPAYYEARNAVTVRADITYLRQDFSVFQPVPHRGSWPEHQRYDYLIRLRPATPADMAYKRPLSEQQQAMLFALRHLTGLDAGTSPREWRRLAVLQSAD